MKLWGLNKFDLRFDTFFFKQSVWVNMFEKGEGAWNLNNVGREDLEFIFFFKDGALKKNRKSQIFPPRPQMKNRNKKSLLNEKCP
jgi:hypothetical protein